MKTKVTITLDDANWRRLRVRALEDGTSASAIIDELITEYLKKKGGKR